VRLLAAQPHLRRRLHAFARHCQHPDGAAAQRELPDYVQGYERDHLAEHLDPTLTWEERERRDDQARAWCRENVRRVYAALPRGLHPLAEQIHELVECYPGCAHWADLPESTYDTARTLAWTSQSEHAALLARALRRLARQRRLRAVLRVYADRVIERNPYLSRYDRDDALIQAAWREDHPLASRIADLRKVARHQRSTIRAAWARLRGAAVPPHPDQTDDMPDLPF
jgi:hypothetical protein